MSRRVFATITDEDAEPFIERGQHSTAPS
jgi:hypothetical protein